MCDNNNNSIKPLLACYFKQKVVSVFFFNFVTQHNKLFIELSIVLLLIIKATRSDKTLVL